ncbi:diacylglycerol/lipid kinase family protein [Demetria terragena]|uniref:diacylglycerol/lipid kinase family protein n=1 Tax=Demetria terragena TaxID=63959 RepID=UPI00035E7905|nr:diacylglycerol kinase family protein [Demetria terragena]
MTAAAPKRTALVLTNPTAGHGRGKRAIEPALAALREHRLDVEMVWANSRDEALTRCAEGAAAHPDLLVSIGGDGTHAVAVQAAVAHQVPLAIVPAGTGNDLARGLRIPRRSPKAAIAVATSGHLTALDVVRARTGDSERYVATVLTAGFDSRVADRTNALTWPGGQARYLLAIAIEYARLRAEPMRVVVDGKVVHDGPAILTAVGNTESYGGGMRICAGADPRDGLLNITVIGAVKHPRLELPLVLPKVFRGTHFRHPAVHPFQGRRVEVEAPTTGYADGDSVGTLPAHLEVVPGALKMMLPRSSPDD